MLKIGPLGFISFYSVLISKTSFDTNTQTHAIHILRQEGAVSYSSRSLYCCSACCFLEARSVQFRGVRGFLFPLDGGGEEEGGE